MPIQVDDVGLKLPKAIQLAQGIKAEADYGDDRYQKSNEETDCR